MCLYRDIKIVDKPKSHGLAWQVYQKVDDQYYSFLFHLPQTPGRWQTADPGHIRGTAWSNFTTYPNGFHVFRKRSDARRVMAGLNQVSPGTNYVMLRVAWQHEVARGLVGWHHRTFSNPAGPDYETETRVVRKRIILWEAT